MTSELQDGGSLFSAVAAADNYDSTMRISQDIPSSEYHPFHLSFADEDRPPLGYLRTPVMLILTEEWPEGSLGRPAFVRRPRSGMNGFIVAFEGWVLKGGFSLISDVMARTASYMKNAEMFPECLGGWRDERYAIFAHPTSPYFQTTAYLSYPPPSKWQNHVFDLERSACAVFGQPTVGVHMTAFEGKGKTMKIWVPRRSATKATWPGKLDNSVAGGIPSGMSPFESLVKECQEEASLSEDFVRDRVKCAGVVTYFYITTSGWLQPEIEYVYDLETAPGQVLKPFDDEVQGFELWEVNRVLQVLRTDHTQFKPNCGLVLVDFLIRHGFITPENEPNLIEITARCKRDLSPLVALPIHQS